MRAYRRIDYAILRRLTARPGTTKAELIEHTAGFADDVKPWLVATPVLLFARRRPLALGRAWLSVGLAAAAASVASALIDRDRPSTAVQDRVHAADRPTSGSMPSTHTASAAAFVSSMLLDDPIAAALLAPVLAFVAWSRVAAARHYPTDVVVGAVVGVTAAAAAGAPTVWLRRHMGNATGVGR